MTDMTQERFVMPALALRGITVFPNLLLHFDVGRAPSIRALEEAMAGGRDIFLVTQRDLSVETPDRNDLYTVGTIASVKQILRLPENNVRVMVEGKYRGRMLDLLSADPYLKAEIEPICSVPAAGNNSPRTEALIRQVYTLMEHYTELSDRVASEVYLKVLASDNPGYISDYAAQNLPLRFKAEYHGTDAAEGG